MNGLSVLRKETPASSLASSASWGRSEKRAAMNRQRAPHADPPWPWPWPSSTVRATRRRRSVLGAVPSPPESGPLLRPLHPAPTPACRPHSPLPRVHPQNRGSRPPSSAPSGHSESHPLVVFTTPTRSGCALSPCQHPAEPARPAERQVNSPGPRLPRGAGRLMVRTSPPFYLRGPT